MAIQILLESTTIALHKTTSNFEIFKNCIKITVMYTIFIFLLLGGDCCEDYDDAKNEKNQTLTTVFFFCTGGFCLTLRFKLPRVVTLFGANFSFVKDWQKII